jgi:thymidylate synthase (FAD)
MPNPKKNAGFLADVVTAFKNFEHADPAKRKASETAQKRTEEAVARLSGNAGRFIGETLRNLTTDEEGNSTVISDDDRRALRDKLLDRVPLTQDEILKMYEETFPVGSGSGPYVDATELQLLRTIVPDLAAWDRARTQSIFVEYSTIELIDAAATDGAVVQGARVSTQGADATDEESAGLINFLMRDRHGSPFEHAWFKFRVTAPIFVWREHMRHRIASYNEQSGRYMKLEPHFYVPPLDRPLVQQGKPGAYTFVAGTAAQAEATRGSLVRSSIFGYMEYERLLEKGVAREVAREALTLNTMSTAIVSMNARALMNFISLRTKSEDAKVPSFPQYEIEEVGKGYEGAFKKLMPLTHAAFVKNGRVAP